MKTIQQTLFLTALLLLLAGSSNLKAQENGGKNVVTQKRETSNFSGVSVGGALTVYLEKADNCLVEVETNENLQDKVKAYVENDILYLKSTTTLKNPTKLNVYVKMPSLSFVRASGATDVKGQSLFEGDAMTLEASGASSVELNLDVQNLESRVSGAADVTYSGRATNHHLVVSGAGSIKARSLVSEKANYNLSGASDASLNVNSEISGEKSGTADLSLVGDPKKTIVVHSGDKDEKYTAYADNYSDSVKVKVGGIKVEVYEGDDSVRVVVGTRELLVDDNGNVKFNRCKKQKFNGHWAGFDLGLNGFLNTDGNQSFIPEYEYLDLEMTKSIAANLNFFEQNVAFSKNQKWGMVTGLGLEWHNYRFSKDTRLNSETSNLIGYIDDGISLRKNKLTTFYLTVPLIFEFQTNSHQKKNSFHIGAGMVAGARLSSHTKKYYDERNKEFGLTLYNSETKQYEEVPAVTMTSPDYSKAKDFDDYFIQPFKFDATVRIGWGFINLYATYSVNEMFKTSKGPEVYPWAIGITLANL